MSLCSLPWPSSTERGSQLGREEWGGGWEGGAWEQQEKGAMAKREKGGVLCESKRERGSDVVAREQWTWTVVHLWQPVSEQKQGHTQDDLPLDERFHYALKGKSRRQREVAEALRWYYVITPACCLVVVAGVGLWTCADWNDRYSQHNSENSLSPCGDEPNPARRHPSILFNSKARATWVYLFSVRTEVHRSWEACTEQSLTAEQCIAEDLCAEDLTKEPVAEDL